MSTIFWRALKVFAYSRLNFLEIRSVKTVKEKKKFQDLWVNIWIEEGYATNREKIQEKYAKYDFFSLDLLAYLFKVLSAGTTRIIFGNRKVGLPVLNDFEINYSFWDSPLEIAEVTLFTVKPAFRKIPHFVALHLLREVYRIGKKAGLKGVVFAADKRLYYLLKRKFKFPLLRIGATKFYEGSLTIPAYLDFKKAEKEVAKTNPALYKFFTG